MKQILGLLIVLIFFSCNTKKTESVDSIQSDKNDVVEAMDFKVVKVEKTNISSDLYKGDIVDIAAWNDENGENLLLLSSLKSTRKETSEMPESVSIELHAYHYVKKGEDYDLVREIKDYSNDCIFAQESDFVLKSLKITDKDNDNYGEAIFIYHLQCASELSPKTIKLLILEDGNKYIIRGNSAVMYSPFEGYMGGGKTIDSELKNAPKEILEYAEQEWVIAQENLAIPKYHKGFDLIEEFENVKFSGNEPFWGIKILKSGLIYSSMGTNDKSFLAYESISKDGDSFMIIAKGKINTNDIKVKLRVSKQKCSDDMSGEQSDYSASLSIDNNSQLHGCGRK